MLHKNLTLASAVLAALLGATTASSIPTAPGFAISFITTPGPAVGDVVATDDVVFVGVGSFGAGSESVVRIESSGSTVVADGFNSLGGFAWDAGNGRLLVGDNAGDLAGAVTGDTLYSISDPFIASGAPPSAAGLEILPSGSLPGYADVLVDPTDPTGDTLFVTDASADFPPIGKLLQVSVASGTSLELDASLGFAAGLASDASTLFVGELQALGFTGQISTVPLVSPDDPLSLLTTGLAGQFDLELSGDGSVLASAGGSILRIDPTDGSSSIVASGFGFATGLWEDTAGVIYALDGFAAVGDENRIWVLTPIPEPGTGLLIGSGVLILALRRRSRFQSAASREKRTGTVIRP